MVKDVRRFYAREMVANGLPPLTFAIERGADGLQVIHEATGDKPLSGYGKNTNAGTESKAAADKVLRAAGIDPDRNHVLIVCQMPDGISPYYGGGSQYSGTCWICDLPGLDSANLASKLSKEATLKLATTPEEAANFRGRALGAHTTVYMGGMAHELGHCFNLPHTGDSPEQHAAWGTSLMGSGNYTYGEELRGAGTGTFLNPTDALRLLAQPLFSGTDKDVATGGDAVFSDLVAKREGEGVRVTGRIASSKVPVYAVVVTYNFAIPGGDYPSNSTASLVDPKTGGFSALISRDHNGPVDLELTALHMNGARSELHTPSVSRGRALDTGRLNLAWAFAGAQRLWSAGKPAEALAEVRPSRRVARRRLRCDGTRRTLGTRRHRHDTGRRALRPPGGRNRRLPRGLRRVVRENRIRPGSGVARHRPVPRIGPGGAGRRPRAGPLALHARAGRLHLRPRRILEKAHRLLRRATRRVGQGRIRDLVGDGKDRSLHRQGPSARVCRRTSRSTSPA